MRNSYTGCGGGSAAKVWAAIDEDASLSDLEKYRLKIKHMDAQDQAGA